MIEKMMIDMRDEEELQNLRNPDSIGIYSYTIPILFLVIYIDYINEYISDPCLGLGTVACLIGSISTLVSISILFS